MVNTVAESDEPWTEKPPRLDVGVVGTGRAGSVIGAALKRAGHQIKACTAVTDLSKLRAEALLPGVAILSIEETVADRDLILLSIPDDVLVEVVSGLAATNAVSPGTFVLHLSGRYGIDILRPLTEQGCLPLALHPVMTFTGTSIDLNRLSACPFGVTTHQTLRPVAETLVMEMGGDPVWVPEASRSLYHAALTFGANNLMTLVNQTSELLESAGISNPELLVAPLLSASLDNALRNGDSALTGPIARGDAQTVREHLRVLANFDPAVTQAYRSLARLTAVRALASGVLQPQNAESLLALLAEQS
ncbi:MAG: DUF2520 domain-containing protein [Candidatus Nanopelagicales bacterium]|nr:DUF2520 domain-containing protein [Candidatus Nanopelagicales bacterium]MDP4895638.1 DUF2520 domain-containing protein [Candidatus Nanopelagicales bacterium]MDP5050701.1 DUF2520 domain-containing protein [Candidatus Nanopelagicales bacterium]